MRRAVVAASLALAMASHVQAVDAVYADRRAILDVMALPFEKILSSRGHVWVVARMVPAYPGGRGVIPGAYIKAETGEVVVPPGSRFVVKDEGTYQILRALTGKQLETEGRYGWERQEGNRRSSIEPLYSPFRSGGVVVCRVQEEREGEARFAQVHLIPDGWEAFVAAAVEFCREDTQVFDPQVGTQSLARLRQIARHDNPVLAGRACEMLALTGQMSGDEMYQLISSSSGHTQALLLCSILQTAPAASRGYLLEHVRHTVEQANTLANLKGIALGAFASVGRHAPRPGSPELLILDMVRRKLEALTSQENASYQYINAILASLKGYLPAQNEDSVPLAARAGTGSSTAEGKNEKERNRATRETVEPLPAVPCPETGSAGEEARASTPAEHDTGVPATELTSGSPSARAGKQQPSSEGTGWTYLVVGLALTLCAAGAWLLLRRRSGGSRGRGN